MKYFNNKYISFGGLTSLIMISLLLLSSASQAQAWEYEVELEPVTIPNLGGVQAFALGHVDNQWLVVGGRLDGLHQRQPFASFDIAGHNNALIVVDAVNKQSWKAPLEDLPNSVKEQLSSTNMEFFQKDGWLYCIGGYGYSATLGDHTTYPNLTALELESLINAIRTGGDITPFIHQIQDPLFQVTGGQLEYVDGIFYLLGGQNFQGRYNPHGPNHGPGFVQEYTEAIRSFQIDNDNGDITITHLGQTVDTDVLHRRDYNAAPYKTNNGEEGMIMFSGVFQKAQDLPFLDAVEVTSNGYRVIPDFEHLLNQYHCPVLAFHDQKNDLMHHMFFGGISQFYFDDDKLIRDDNVPFVNTIGLTTRTADGKMTEQALSSTMPDLLGASGEFIPNVDLALTESGILNWSEAMENTLDVGYVFGGIRSSAQNIFFVNDGTQSNASATLFKVRVTRRTPSGVFDYSSENHFHLTISPNPGQGGMNITFQLDQADSVDLSIVNMDGQQIWSKSLGDLGHGEHTESVRLNNIPAGDYLVVLSTPQGQQAQKIVIHR